jgi:hypothetical protein
VNLKPVLGEIETDCDSLHGGRLLSVVALIDDHVVAHRCRGAGAVHPIKIFALGSASMGSVCYAVQKSGAKRSRRLTGPSESKLLQAKYSYFQNDVL